MPDLSFQVENATAVPFAAAPLLSFGLRVTQVGTEDPGTTIHTVVLHCQIRIEPTRRHYAPQERAKLLDLFGDPPRWGQTLRSMLWTHASVVVPAFGGSTVVELPVPCTYDFNIAATKYFAALADGEVPLCLLFSGTIFYAEAGGGLQAMQIPWEKEATFRLPIRVWKDMMDLYYPNTVWLCLQKDVFERLYEYKRREGIPTWEQAVENLLPASGVPAAVGGQVQP
jgi:hypothetical protein